MQLFSVLKREKIYPLRGHPVFFYIDLPTEGF
jgi:hypothetical protein